MLEFTYLEYLRIKHNVSKTELAKAVGLTVSGYCFLEKKEDLYTVPTKHILALSKFYKISSDEILSHMDNKIKFKEVE